MRIFLDANILFSAAKSNGAVRQLLELLRDSGHTLCADDYVVAEARRNLELKAPDSGTALEDLLGQIDVAPFEASELPSDVAALLPEKDWPVLAAAIRRRCETLVTGDRTHFGALYGKTITGVSIHSPRSLAEAVLTKKP
ncbi:MAG TPA: PIN domain-containing protein [Gammaproteobacteria bacterium]|nr:PIN domain-containing protein [Gammaproteobacteria bacterium]